MQNKYDYLVVGSGLAGCLFGYLMSKKNKKVLIIEKKEHIGGRCFSYNVDGIEVHKYGAHIFRTNDKWLWDFVNSIDKFNNFINSPIANYKGEYYNLPFNMNTFNKLWGAGTPEEAMKKIEKQKVINSEPNNLEEYILNLVGVDIYEKLIKGYTEKQWGKKCNELPKDLMRRIPLRFTYNNNYYNVKYQGIPENGYTYFMNKLIENCDVILNSDFNLEKDKYLNLANKIVYTGSLDEYYNYELGELEWRSLRFETKELNMKDFQGNAVVNYTDYEIPYTRIIEHKHFNNDNDINKTIITYEFPDNWDKGKEKFYTINDEKNNNLYLKYKEKAENDGLILVGTLAEYKYYEMEETMKSVFDLVNKIENE